MMQCDDAVLIANRLYRMLTPYDVFCKNTELKMVHFPEELVIEGILKLITSSQQF